MFCIDAEKKYLIYGAGGNGLKVYSMLQKANCGILGFIDKRAKSMHKIGEKQLWTLEDAAIEFSEKNDLVVIITTKNVFEHNKIAGDLSNAGFLNCIYKPNEILQGIEEKDLYRISQAHDSFIIDKKIPYGLYVKKTQPHRNIVLRNRLVISKGETTLTVWLPNEILFNYQFEDAYAGINMPLFFPLVELYRYFLGEYRQELQCEQVLNNFYLYCMEWMQKNNFSDSEDLRNSLLSSRNQIFFEMQKMADIDQNFFTRNVPEAEIDNEGRFYLTSSGRNRIAFLIAKGHHYIPVKIKREDYKFWENKEAYDELLRYLNENEIDTLQATVPHPYMCNMMTVNVDYFRLFCQTVANIMSKQLYEKSRSKKNGLWCVDFGLLKENRNRERIGCQIQDNGYVSRYLWLLGFNVERKKEADKLEQGLIERLDMLLHIKADFTETDKPKTIWIIDSRNYTSNRCDVIAARQIFLLNWGEGQNLLEEFLRAGYLIKDILFHTMWDTQKVSGYWFLSNEEKGLR